MRWPLALYRVAGHSMQPTYQPGDTLLGWRGWHAALSPNLIQPGCVVVAQIEGEWVIKRVVNLQPTDKTARGVKLAGDNAADSRDSRHYGLVPLATVQARILGRLP